MDYSKLKTDDEIAAMGERDAARILGLKLHAGREGADHHTHGVDANDDQGRTYEIKARAVRTVKILIWKKYKRIEYREDPYNLNKYKYNDVDRPYDFLVVFKYDEFGKLLQVAKLAKKDVIPKIKESKGHRYVRVKIIDDPSAVQISIR